MEVKDNLLISDKPMLIPIDIYIFYLLFYISNTYYEDEME